MAEDCDQGACGHTRWAFDDDPTRDELEALATFHAVYVGYPRASVAVEVICKGVAAKVADGERARRP